MSKEKMKKKNSNKNKKILFIIIFLIGLGFIFYPLISQLYYDNEFQSEVEDYRETLINLDPPELKDKNLRLAEAYNEALEPNLKWVDPYSDEDKEAGVRNYANMLKLKEKIGVINISKINISLPIYAGTSESILQKGAGHLEGTSLPVGGSSTLSVITAHRGLPEARLFTDLDKLEVGDIFSIESMAGELYYEVDKIETVKPSETDKVKIVEGRDYVILLTCTPYMINSHRLLVRGHRIEAPKEEIVKENEVSFDRGISYYLSIYWTYLLIIFIALVLFFIIIKREK